MRGVLAPKYVSVFAAIGLLCWAISFAISRKAEPPGTAEIALRVEQSLAEVVRNVDREAALLQGDSLYWDKATHPFFLLQGNSVVKWNNNQYLPDSYILLESFHYKFLAVARGDFLIIKYPMQGSRALIAVLPLVERYKIENSFLKTSWNEQVFGTKKVLVRDAFSPGTPVRLDGERVITIKVQPGAQEFYFTNSTIAIWWCGLVAITIAVYFLLQFFALIRRNYLSAFLILAGTVIVVRLVALLANFPSFFDNWRIYDPRLFASSWLNPSLADLLLNTLCVLLIIGYLFFTYARWRVVAAALRLSQWIRFSLAALALLITFFSLLFPFLYIETLYHNSTIYPDVTQLLNTDVARTISFICIGLAGVVSFLAAHVSLRFAVSLVPNRMQLAVICFASAFVFMLYSIVLGRHYWITLGIALAFICIVIVFRLYRSLSRISFRTFVYVLSCILLLALQNASSVGRFAEEERIKSQIRFANEFLVGRDFLGEYMLNEALGNIKNDPFIQNRLASPFSSKASVREKIRQIHLGSYFDRYDISIALFDAAGLAVEASQGIHNLAETIATYQQAQWQTAYEGIYLTQGQKDDARKYLGITAVSKNPMAAGFVVIELSLKKRVPTNVYPELFIDNRFAIYHRIREFSYAVFDGEEIESSFGDFNYEKLFKPAIIATKALYTKGVRVGGFTHIAVQEDENRVAIVSSPSYPLFFAVGNFFFWTALGVLLLLMVLAIRGIAYWRKHQQLTYSLRIQFYFYVALLLPLLTVGVTTLSITTRSAETQLNNEYSSKAQMMSESLEADLVALLENDSMAREEFANRLADVARLSGNDISIFNAKGKLLASSQPLVYDYQFKSPLLDYTAWRSLVKERESVFVKEDRIGQLSYNSAYAPVRSPYTGNVIAVVSLPFFRSGLSLQRSRVTIFINILSVFTSVIVVFSLLSISVANRLTKPLRTIARSLGRTSFAARNEPLNWKSNDEIGTMVREYNQMVNNLEESKQALARSEKESAWREIARQVAHEIKNPLTPIKLTLQQMQLWLVNKDQPLQRERAVAAVKTVLGQVDILNDIASSFGTFARMPTPVMVTLDLNELLQRVVTLYKGQLTADVYYDALTAPVPVRADDALLTRIFSNLILNGAQAAGGQFVVVKIKLSLGADPSGAWAMVEVADNGMGIPDAIADKIFTPYFSTKKSGSGLGLAIVKQGVEQCGGDITFSTTEGKGTTFFVRLPRIV